MVRNSIASVEMIDSVPLGGDRVKCTPLGRFDVLIVDIVVVKRDYVEGWWMLIWCMGRRNAEVVRSVYFQGCYSQFPTCAAKITILGTPHHKDRTVGNWLTVNTRWRTKSGGGSSLKEAVMTWPDAVGYHRLCRPRFTSE
jgi:hypothetical protein